MQKDKNKPVVGTVTTSLKPNTGKVLNSNKPVLGELPKKISWYFSFRYFKEIEYFGLHNVKSSWMSSFLNRLENLSSFDVLHFESPQSKQLRKELRYHVINWNAKNIPIQKSALTWLDADVQKNIDEIDFYQFQLSTAMGRVVGYWEKGYKVFYVILVDPLHNIQPSADYDYRIDPCYPGQTELALLHRKVDEALHHGCKVENCKVYNHLKEVYSSVTPSHILIAHIDSEYLEFYKEITSTVSPSEFLKQAIIDRKFGSETST